MLVAREGEPGVDDEDVLAQLEDGHVLAHLAEPAEGNDAKSCHKEKSKRVWRDAACDANPLTRRGGQKAARSRQSFTARALPGVASTSGRRKPPTS